MLGRSLRTELSYTGATATVLYPGWVNTTIAKTALADDTTGKLAKAAIPNY